MKITSFCDEINVVFYTPSGLTVGGAGKKAPPSHISSEGGDRGMVGRGKKETPLRLAFCAREGHWSGQGMFYTKKALNKAGKL